MTPEQLVTTFPRLWHMAEDGSWPSISKRGLLSTEALLDLYDIEAEQRKVILSNRRPTSVTISRRGLPDAVVRDQKPMSERGLRKCLGDGLTPGEWCEILNKKVFFWTSEERLLRLLGAKAYRKNPQTVLTVRTETLVRAHRNRILLSPINSGSTIYNPQPRGRNTFLPIEEYPFEAMIKRKGSRGNAVVELTVSGGVPDIMEHLIAVHRVVNEVWQELWPPPRPNAR